MEEAVMKDSRYFDVEYYGIKVKIELYTKKYILETLKQYEDTFEIYSFVLPKKKPFSEIKKIYLDDGKKEKYHFFAYIKFFEYENEIYGLVGGKTNYPQPDILFDFRKNNKDNRYARYFLEQNKLKWSREVIVVNHKENEFYNIEKENQDMKSVDNQQAKFIESFLKRRFNLFDS